MNRKCILRRREVLFPLAALGYNLLVYCLGNVLGGGREALFLHSAADEAIPLLPWTVLIYVGAFPFWAVNYSLACRGEKEQAQRFLLAHLLGETVCFFVFVFLPTAMVRPELPADGPLVWALALVYRVDTPRNLLPSIHCFASYLCWRGVHGRADVPKWYRVFSLCFAAAVCVSTLTVKQHVLADAAAGLALGELCYLAAGAAVRLLPGKEL